MTSQLKQLKVRVEIHKQLKVEAIERGLTLQELVEQIINDYLNDEK